MKCNACKGVGSVWILPLDYKEWEPETWAREVCSRCRGDRVVECPRCSGRKGRLEARAA